MLGLSLRDRITNIEIRRSEVQDAIQTIATIKLNWTEHII